MKSIAHCCICNKEFGIKELRFIPWPQKHSWKTVGIGEQQYKIHCPHCDSCLVPAKEMDASALSQLKQIKVALTVLVILCVILGLFGFGNFGLAMLQIFNLAILSMFYKMVKYKTGNIFGSGILKMNADK
jgi:hypothetical protein